MLIQAPIDTQSGYGAHSRDIIKSLFNRYRDTYDIVINPMGWGNTPFGALNPESLADNEILGAFLNNNKIMTQQPEIFIQIAIPNEFQRSGKFLNIGITAGIETTIASAEWIEGCNKMDLIIVPAKHGAESLASSTWTKHHQKTKEKIEEIKLQAPITTLFEGIDTAIYKQTEKISKKIKVDIDKIPSDFIFCFVGHWLNGDLGQDRKDIGMLIVTFINSFKGKENKPALLLKTSAGGYSHMDYDIIRQKIDMIIKTTFPNESDLPDIYILHGELSDIEMNDLYNHPKIKTMISFTKGEGYGRPLAEFSPTGKPIIVSKWSGHLDFLTPRGVVYLEGHLEKVHPSAVWDKIILPESEWFTVDYDNAKKKMINVYEHYNTYKQKAIYQKNNIEKRFTLEIMEEKLFEIMEEYLNKIPKEMEINLPKLKKLV